MDTELDYYKNNGIKNYQQFLMLIQNQQFINHINSIAILKSIENKLINKKNKLINKIDQMTSYIVNKDDIENIEDDDEMESSSTDTTIISSNDDGGDDGGDDGDTGTGNDDGDDGDDGGNGNTGAGNDGGSNGAGDDDGDDGDDGGNGNTGTGNDDGDTGTGNTGTGSDDGAGNDDGDDGDDGGNDDDDGGNDGGDDAGNDDGDNGGTGTGTAEKAIYFQTKNIFKRIIRSSENIELINSIFDTIMTQLYANMTYSIIIPSYFFPDGKAGGKTDDILTLSMNKGTIRSALVHIDLDKYSNWYKKEPMPNPKTDLENFFIIYDNLNIDKNTKKEFLENLTL